MMTRSMVRTKNPKESPKMKNFELKSLSPGFKRIAENVVNSGKKKFFGKSKKEKE